MTEYDTTAYRCKVCGEKPALIKNTAGRVGQVGIGCECTSDDDIFVPFNTKELFGFLVPDRWVLE